MVLKGNHWNLWIHPLTVSQQLGKNLENKGFLKSNALSYCPILGRNKMFWTRPKKTFQQRISHFEPCPKRSVLSKTNWTNPNSFSTFKRTRKKLEKKSEVGKKYAPKLPLFFIEKQFKIQMILDIENSFWKSDFWNLANC